MPANYVLLNRVELNAATSSVTFSNIPQSGYTDLKLVLSTRTTASVTDVYFNMNFNNDTGANYTMRSLSGSGATATSDTWTSQNNAYVYQSDGNTATASTFSNIEIYIPNYTGSTQKSFSTDGVAESNTTTANNRWNALQASIWTGTAAINRVSFTPASGSFVQYSTFSLYGIAAVGTTPVIAPKATGGNITTDGTYWIHTFNTTGAFVPATSLSCDYLVVAGGGGGGDGGGGGGGGGGAGGFLTSIGGTPLSLSLNTSYTVTVGAGGAGAPAYTSRGSSGTNSILSSITATGGGGGGSYDTLVSGLSGGSGGGGGGANVAGSGGSASPSGQGNAGGNGSTSPITVGGGGGGAGASGGNATSSAAGAGGIGLASTITGTSIYYAGGGGGATGGGGGTRGAGGNGGGGNGQQRLSPQIAGSSGTVNTGGGGGGVADPTTGGGSYSGGSGIVIIRYAI